MDSDLTPLVVLASLWAAFSAVISGFKVVNDVRDRILTGRDSEGELTLEHRRLLFENDWKPLKTGIGLMLVVLAAVILIVGEYLFDEWMLFACYLCVAVSAFAALGFLRGFLVDRAVLAQTLEAESQAAERG